MPYENLQTIAPLPPVERGRSFVLSGDPKGKNFVYCAGNSVVIRDIANPSIADIYTEHSAKTTVAKYSPSGFYICSADKSGKVRIWDTCNKEHILKYEYHPFGGEIRDLAWDGESKRILVGGDGRQTYAAAFLWDSGSKCGDFTGLGKTVTSVDLKSGRPFRAICGSDDATAVFYNGVPYKFNKSLKDHERFVNCVRFNPAGDLFATVSSDGKLIFYDGKEGEKKSQVDKAHAGGIYACSWSADGKQIVTASGDKTCKIWDVETSSVVNEFKIGDDIKDQQYGCLWQNNDILSVSLSGKINYLDKNSGKICREIMGHQKNINCLTYHSGLKAAITADYDGNVCYWDAIGGEAKNFTGKGHGTSVNDVATDNLDGLVTVGNDNKLRISSISEQTISDSATDLGGQPKSIAFAGNNQPVVLTTEAALVVNGNKVSTTNLGFEPSCIACFGDKVVIGAKEKSGAFQYSLAGGELTNQTEIAIKDPVFAMRFSPDGQKLAVADKSNCISVVDSNDHHVIEKVYGHRARITTLAFSENGWLASGNIDQKIFVHNFEDRKVEIPLAHRMAAISGIEWTSDTRLISSAQDGSLKTWEISFN